MADFEAVLKVSDLGPGEVAKVQYGVADGPWWATSAAASFAVGSTCPHAEMPIVEEQLRVGG